MYAYVTVSDIEVLEHLSYIIEALAEELPGEAGREISALRERLDAIKPADADRIREVLAQAERPPQAPATWPRVAAVALSGLSRELWRRVMKEVTAAEVHHG
jgi:AcrR family transcriptional regulator